jgi:hypothetical protein
MCRRAGVASPHLNFAAACRLNRRGYISLKDRQKSFETDPRRYSFSISRPVVKRCQSSINSKRSVILATGLDRIGLRGLGAAYISRHK